MVFFLLKAEENNEILAFLS